VAIKQNEKYDEKRLDERHRDHSLFIAFAPADKPTIALALIVENGGFGSRALTRRSEPGSRGKRRDTVQPVLVTTPETRT
jgi:cell division protein FtsI/penicillin-binding protein 2